MTRPRADLSNQTFGRLTAIEYFGTNSALWICRCTCGAIKKVRSGDLKAGTVKSCGCLQVDENKSRAKHNLCDSKLYSVWGNIKKRCYNPKSEFYSYYGGRGIKVCDGWLESFENFYNDMKEGYKEGLTIERIDNNGHYCKENCRWATRKEQGQNKRNNILYKGKTLAEWADIKGINYFTLKRRLELGWSWEKALNTPIRKYN